MINLNNVSKAFSGFQAVDSINMNIEKNSIVGFIGPNGAGKTTTLKMITGQLKPDAGSILVNGYDIVNDAINAKKQFGFVSDDPNTFLKLKGIEYLNFIGDIYEVDTTLRQERIERYSSMFKLEQSLNDKIQSYSHGMRQKIKIIGVLLHNPDIFILDEPLTGLDPQAAFDLKKIMKEHASQDKCVLFSTHVLEVAEKLCDAIIIINHGHILYTGTLDALKAQYEGLSLEEIFLEVTR
ncbi:hypothetical protein AOC36_04645 [Erysipelothrix larvae]|uniref:ABC transporter domain-containing protein n=1 Tax=Erysipelothrix larvae TaxID=1514105 RepID=A0A120JTL8_9FIRM|nr:ABC transporter ATP-binding protein [Erysipelothrix larvae]AMC93285.1 hypothetical protein AOC36_04645 [Erysipelothrix larvae]